MDDPLRTATNASAGASAAPATIAAAGATVVSIQSPHNHPPTTHQPRRKAPADIAAAWDNILDQIAAGKPLAEVCRQPNMPTPSAVLHWLERADDATRQAYARAREASADQLADEIVSIADEVKDCADVAAVAAARLRVDARKWVAAKLKPQSYGDRIQVDAAPIEVANMNVLVAEMRALMAPPNEE